MIGCFEALDRGLITDVVYFFDLTDERKLEALKTAEMFGFTPHFLGEHYFGLPKELNNLGPDDTIFCPTIRDSHAQHAEVSIRARIARRNNGCQLVFYTVDMDSFQYPLGKEKRAKKKSVLQELFPTQSVLLTNEKYHLFEGYSEKDHYQGIEFPLADDRKVVMKGYQVPSLLEAPWDESIPDEEYLNILITRYFSRLSVSYIAVHNGNRWVEFNG
ncbi:hypothetical protein [Xanthomonas phage BUDD]|nr:hypothetical protein [Xanthomonas phage BUDD]